LSKTYRVVVQEMATSVYEIQVADDFRPPPPEELDEWADVIGKNDLAPCDVEDVQIQRVVSAVRFETN